ncbi:MAG: cytochrome c [Ghiorsea sp.]|nr:cytochrome c [Ghiorsea sp.]
MKAILTAITSLTVAVFLVQPATASDMPDGAKIFSQKCKMCHAIDKKKVGPAVQAMNADAEVLRTTITDGRKRMPKFGKKLSTEQIDALVEFIQTQKL